MSFPWEQQRLGRLPDSPEYQHLSEYLSGDQSSAPYQSGYQCVDYLSAGPSSVTSHGAPQYFDIMSADSSLTADQGGSESLSVSSLRDSSTTPSPEISKSRPGVHEKRNDAEPVVYRELDSFPSFNTPVPAEATIEEICIRYPNHLRGSYLDAFIQWRWTATDIFTHLTEKAREEFKTCGVSRSKAFGNRANFLMKRLDARLSLMSAEEVTRLCLSPKRRGCLMTGGEYYGGSKLQGKFHNPAAPPVRYFPQRRGVARKGRASTSAVALTAQKTFTLDGQEYKLWVTFGELETFRKAMATQWNRQRGRAEDVINADAAYANCADHQRNQLILRITNWPANPSTETFFSFRDVEDCPTFVGAINDKVVECVVEMLDFGPAADSGSIADLKFDQRLALARKSAIDYVLQAQAARLSRLDQFVSSLPAKHSLYDVVNQVLRWNQDIEQGESAPMEAQSIAQIPFDGNITASQNQLGTDMCFKHAIDANHIPPDESPRNPFGGKVAMSQNPDGSNMSFHNSLLATNNSATQKFRPLAPKPVASKRPRDESAEQVNPGKRVRFAESATHQDFGSADVGLLGQALLDPVSLGNSSTMTSNVGPAAASALPIWPEDISIGNWQFSESSDHCTSWPEMPAAEEGDWLAIGMAEGFVPEEISQPTDFGVWFAALTFAPAAPYQASSNADLAFTLEAPIEDREFEVEEMSGVKKGSNADFNLATGVDEVIPGGAGSHEVADWALPDMLDDDPDWLKDEIEKAMALGPLDEEALN